MSRLRSLAVGAVAILCVLYIATWPGAVTRPAIVELTAAPLPEDVGDRDGVLDVVVTDATGDQPALANARVRAFAILDGRAHDAGEATTDAAGRATLKRLPHAEHWIVAEAAGHARGSQMVVIVAGSRRLDLELAAEHVLDVEVKNEQGGAIPSAEIEVRGSDPFPVGARADARGRADVGRLGEGPYTVTVRAPGFEDRPAS
jgi:hypothetical protein